jgi:hypothetical protein
LVTKPVAKSLYVVNQSFKLFRYVVICLFLWSVVRELRLCVVALAGQNTSVIVEATIKALADVKLVVSFAATGLASIWAVSERGLRHQKSKEMGLRIAELEKVVHPKRTSSGLTPEGKTHLRDRRA